eukprot:gnl/MRDRNA2_/MRDRNA2_90998_c0_seq1.p1 gnl/MRDRNA2_/MRDRNA2_90998_c0~~gnl/MRDRNA2_/MRDRNA2_90998_c0_seq1.p1  ORF type:complete len:1976 (+),score=452.65 gnl/MRDRNA2_/MRDRNA2_90998_c0_seq1:768-6695(+)
MRNSGHRGSEVAKALGLPGLSSTLDNFRARLSREEEDLGTISEDEEEAQDEDDDEGIGSKKGSKEVSPEEQARRARIKALKASKRQERERKRLEKERKQKAAEDALSQALANLETANSEKSLAELEKVLFRVPKWDEAPDVKTSTETAPETRRRVMSVFKRRGIYKSYMWDPRANTVMVDTDSGETTEKFKKWRNSLTSQEQEQPKGSEMTIDIEATEGDEKPEVAAPATPNRGDEAQEQASMTKATKAIIGRLKTESTDGRRLATAIHARERRSILIGQQDAFGADLIVNEFQDQTGRLLARGVEFAGHSLPNLEGWIYMSGRWHENKKGLSTFFRTWLADEDFLRKKHSLKASRSKGVSFVGFNSDHGISDSASSEGNVTRVLAPRAGLDTVGESEEGKVEQVKNDSKPVDGQAEKVSPEEEEASWQKSLLAAARAAAKKASHDPAKAYSVMQKYSPALLVLPKQYHSRLIHLLKVMLEYEKLMQRGLLEQMTLNSCPAGQPRGFPPTTHQGNLMKGHRYLPGLMAVETKKSRTGSKERMGSKEQADAMERSASKESISSKEGGGINVYDDLLVLGQSYDKDEWGHGIRRFLAENVEHYTDYQDIPPRIEFCSWPLVPNPVGSTMRVVTGQCGFELAPDGSARDRVHAAIWREQLRGSRGGYPEAKSHMAELMLTRQNDLRNLRETLRSTRDSMQGQPDSVDAGNRDSVIGSLPFLKASGHGPGGFGDQQGRRQSALNSEGVQHDRRTSVQPQQLQAQQDRRQSAMNFQAPQFDRKMSVQPQQELRRSSVQPQQLQTLMRRESMQPQQAQSSLMRRESVQPQGQSLMRRESSAFQSQGIQRRESVQPKQGDLRRESVAMQSLGMQRRDSVQPQRGGPSDMTKRQSVMHSNAQQMSQNLMSMALQRKDEARRRSSLGIREEAAVPATEQNLMISELSKQLKAEEEADQDQEGTPMETDQLLAVAALKLKKMLMFPDFDKLRMMPVFQWNERMKEQATTLKDRMQQVEKKDARKSVTNAQKRFSMTGEVMSEDVEAARAKLAEKATNVAKEDSKATEEMFSDVSHVRESLRRGTINQLGNLAQSLKQVAAKANEQKPNKMGKWRKLVEEAPKGTQIVGRPTLTEDTKMKLEAIRQKILFNGKPKGTVTQKVASDQPVTAISEKAVTNMKAGFIIAGNVDQEDAKQIKFCPWGNRARQLIGSSPPSPKEDVRPAMAEAVLKPAGRCRSLLELPTLPPEEPKHAVLSKDASGATLDTRAPGSDGYQATPLISHDGSMATLSTLQNDAMSLSAETSSMTTGLSRDQSLLSLQDPQGVLSRDPSSLTLQRNGSAQSLSLAHDVSKQSLVHSTLTEESDDPYPAGTNPVHNLSRDSSAAELPDDIVAPLTAAANGTGSQARTLVQASKVSEEAQASSDTPAEQISSLLAASGLGSLEASGANKGNPRQSKPMRSRRFQRLSRPFQPRGDWHNPDAAGNAQGSISESNDVPSRSSVSSARNSVLADTAGKRASTALAPGTNRHSSTSSQSATETAAVLHGSMSNQEERKNTHPVVDYVPPRSAPVRSGRTIKASSLGSISAFLPKKPGTADSNCGPLKPGTAGSVPDDGLTDCFPPLLEELPEELADIQDSIHNSVSLGFSPPQLGAGKARTAKDGDSQDTILPQASGGGNSNSSNKIASARFTQGMLQIAPPQQKQVVSELLPRPSKLVEAASSDLDVTKTAVLMEAYEQNMSRVSLDAWLDAMSAKADAMDNVKETNENIILGGSMASLFAPQHNPVVASETIKSNNKLDKPPNMVETASEEPQKLVPMSKTAKTETEEPQDMPAMSKLFHGLAKPSPGRPSTSGTLQQGSRPTTRGNSATGSSSRPGTCSSIPQQCTWASSAAPFSSSTTRSGSCSSSSRPGTRDMSQSRPTTRDAQQSRSGTRGKPPLSCGSALQSRSGNVEPSPKPGSMDTPRKPGTQSLGGKMTSRQCGLAALLK